MTTWKIEINSTLHSIRCNEAIIFCTLSEEELNKEFYNGHGLTKGAPFTAWTESWVLFPICYDGSEWCGYAPRNPTSICMEHQGG